jgi:hypothetical protein
MAVATGGSKPTGGVFDIDNKNITWQTCTCNAGHACSDNRSIASGKLGSWCTCNAAQNSTVNRNVQYDSSKLPHTVSVSKVKVGDTITAAQWNGIRASIVDSNSYRNSSSTSTGIIGNIPVGADIKASNYMNLKTHLKDYNKYDIPDVSAGDTITAVQINKLIDAIQGQNNLCTCQCNYCTCQCNNCPCNVQYNTTCTCYCNYCTCVCAHSCTCQCNYSDAMLKEEIKYL